MKFKVFKYEIEIERGVIRIWKGACGRVILFAKVNK